MTVMSAEGEIPNVQIKWYSENATNCTCTKSTGGGCGTGVSPVVTEAVYATGEGVVDLGDQKEVDQEEMVEQEEVYQVCVR